jgi:hypothetical protein
VIDEDDTRSLFAGSVISVRPLHVFMVDSIRKQDLCKKNSPDSASVTGQSPHELLDALIGEPASFTSIALHNRATISCGSQLSPSIAMSQSQYAKLRCQNTARQAAIFSIDASKKKEVGLILSGDVEIERRRRVHVMA